MGEMSKTALRVDSDRNLKLELHGSKVMSDTGLLAYPEPGETLGLMWWSSPMDAALRSSGSKRVRTR